MPRYDMPPFDRLACVSKEFPVIQSGHYWVVAPSLANQWELLENNLMFIASYLQRSTPSSILLPLDFRLVSRPTEYGYKRSHKSKFGAQRAARYSRDAFLPLMAWCTYLISYDHVFITPPNKPDKVLRWEFLLHQSGMNPDSIEELTRSELIDFLPEYPRAGLLLTYEHWQFHSMILCLRRDNVPVWIYWGKLGSSLPRYGPLPQYIPTKDELGRAVGARERAKADAALDAAWAIAAKNSVITSHIAHDEADNSEQATFSEQPPPSPTLHKAPVLEPFSGQRIGETWKAYLSRMAKKREERLAAEPDSAKESRESREAAQSKHPCPGRGSKAPVVWHWKADDETGFRIRTRVSRQMVPDIWSEYTNTQRTYNSLANEWDICTELDPDAAPESFDSDEDNDDYYGIEVDSMPISLPQADLPSSFPAHHLITPAPHSPTSHQPAAVTSHTLAPLAPSQQPIAQSNITSAPSSSAAMPLQPLQWRIEHADNFNHPSTVSRLLIPDHTTETFHERYGFVDPGINRSEFEFQINWGTMLKILGRQDAVIQRRLHAPISHFVERMISAQHNRLGDLWDLSPDCYSRMVDHANPELRVTRVVDMQVRYILSARRASNNDVPWQLVLDDAATVLECLRQRRMSICAIAAYLFSSGRPFSTRIRREECRRSPFKFPPVVTLGWRPPSHRPTTYEYNYYEEIRTSFFRHPHSRAAAYKKGGIIWRLSLESTDMLIDETVLGGPSDEVLSHGSCIGSDETLWDDDVSENEMDLICGVYKVFTGTFHCK